MTIYYTLPNTSGVFTWFTTSTEISVIAKEIVESLGVSTYQYHVLIDNFDKYIIIHTTSIDGHVPYTKNTTFGKYLDIEPEIPINIDIDTKIVDLTDFAPFRRNDIIADSIALFYKDVLRQHILGPCINPTLSAVAMVVYGIFLGKRTVVIATQDKNNYFYELYHKFIDYSNVYVESLISTELAESSVIFCNPEQVEEKTIGLCQGLYNMVTIDYRLGSSVECAIAKHAYLTKGCLTRKQRSKPQQHQAFLKKTNLRVIEKVRQKDGVLSKRHKKMQQVISSYASKEYPTLFEKDLDMAYSLTSNMASIDEKIKVWKAMPLVALDTNKRNSNCSNRKTWILLCLLMANTELKHWFSDEEMARIPTEHVLKDMRSLTRYKNLSTTQSWRAWSGHKHLTRTDNGYMLSWKNSNM